jgi:hypothetical protein
MACLNPYSIKTTMGFVKSKKLIQSDSFFLHSIKNKHFLLYFWPPKKKGKEKKKKKKNLNLRNQTEATQSRQIKLNLRNPYKETSTNS